MKNRKSIIEFEGRRYTLAAYEELSGCKVCTLCNTRLQLHNYKHKPRISKRGITVQQYNSTCKQCDSKIQLNFYYRNREAKIEYQKRLNREKVEQYRPKKNARDSKRRASKQNATPQWLTDDDLIQITALFDLRLFVTKETGVEHQVDHIIPLNGTTVCGLHVPWNLRVIPAAENLNKSASIDIDLLSQLYTGFEPTEITPELYYLLSQHDDKLKFKQA